MSLLFGKGADTIGLHIRNAYKAGELEESATTGDASVVQNEGHRNVRRKVRLYNLDVVLLVGYRVQSTHGTRFRQGATHALRDHLIKGYTANEQRLKELNQTIRLVADGANRRELTGNEATAVRCPG